MVLYNVSAFTIFSYDSISTESSYSPYEVNRVLRTNEYKRLPTYDTLEHMLSAANEMPEASLRGKYKDSVIILYKGLLKDDISLVESIFNQTNKIAMAMARAQIQKYNESKGHSGPWDWTGSASRLSTRIKPYERRTPSEFISRLSLLELIFKKVNPNRLKVEWLFDDGKLFYGYNLVVKGDWSISRRSWRPDEDPYKHAQNPTLEIGEIY